MIIKVAFFVAGLNSGGTENYLLRFLSQYKKEIQATVYCKSGKTGELEKEYIAEGIRIKKFRIGYFNPLHLLGLKKELRKEQYHSIVDFTGNFSAFPMLVANDLQIENRITWYRNADDKFKKDYLRMFYNKLLNKITLKNTSVILSNSKAALDYFYKDYDWQKDQKFEVIYNGIKAEQFLSTNDDLRNEFNIPKNSFVVGNIGRYNEQKNHKTAIQVAIDICRNDDDIYFIFCGKGVDIALRDMVKTENLEHRIILQGMRRDIIKVLNTLDCFYFPSILEGQPNSLIEAMISGVPFLASDIEPIKETVPEELHSFLVPALDIKKAKDALLRMKNDEAFKNKFLIKDWAINAFDSDKQFKQFFDKLK